MGNCILLTFKYHFQFHRLDRIQWSLHCSRQPIKWPSTEYKRYWGFGGATNKKYIHIRTYENVIENLLNIFARAYHVAFRVALHHIHLHTINTFPMFNVFISILCISLFQHTTLFRFHIQAESCRLFFSFPFHFISFCVCVWMLNFQNKRHTSSFPHCQNSKWNVKHILYRHLKFPFESRHFHSIVLSLVSIRYSSNSFDLFETKGNENNRQKGKKHINRKNNTDRHEMKEPTANPYRTFSI